MKYVLIVFYSINIYAQYHVVYNGNGSDGGVVPIDSNSYSSNEMAMVKWEEPLLKTNFIFACWNTQADGSGTNYSPDADSSGPTLQINNTDVTLYAQWGYCTTPSTNYALNFNEGQFLGNDDDFESVNIENMPAFTTAITIESWINPSTFDAIEGHNNPVILKFYTEDVYIGLINNGGSHVLSWNGLNAYGVTDIPENQWTHVVFVLNGNALQAMYINGIAETFSVTGLVALPSSNQWVIGNMTWSASPYRWHGKIDEIRIWNVARTATQIQQNFNRKLSGSEQNLIAYWDFDKGSNTQLLCDHNLNGEQHSGVLRNMESIDWVTGVPFSTLGISQVALKNSFYLYPNPVKNTIMVKNNLHLTDARFNILNVTGSIIKKGVLSETTSNIDMRGINAGIYFLKISAKNLITTQKIILE